jgi:zinc transporter 1/2/3
MEMKYAAAAVVLLAGIAGGAFANRLTRWRSSKWIARLANTFAGGVFLGAALMHMLPDARDKFDAFFTDMQYPYYTLVAAVSFLLVLLLDKRVVLSRSNSESIYPYLLALVLSVHSIITGIAFGLEQHFVGAAAILVAILAHKTTAAMALGISFNREHIDKQRSRNLMRMFYVTTPIGIVFGTWWSGLLQGPSGIIAAAVFDALAAGTFFYIAVVDILVEEFKVEEFKAPRLGWLFLSTVLGFSIMAVIAVWH